MKRGRNHRVEVTCPHCFRVQRESTMAVSTFCRSCGNHYDISKGKAVPPPGARAQRVRTRLSYDNNDAPESTGVILTPQDDQQETPGRPHSWLEKAARPFASAGAGRPREPFSRSGRKAKSRLIACFECGHEQEVSTSASSSICPSCSAYISLRNVEVKNEARQKIRTWGDLVVQKKASLHGSDIACRNLKVQGWLSGGVQCSGDASFYSDSKVLDAFSCRKLFIHKKAKVHFLQPVHVCEMEIHGEVTGDFYCAGDVSVRRSGAIRGELLAKSLKIDPGGILDGSLRVCSNEAQARREAEEAERALRLAAEEEAAAPAPDPVALDSDWVDSGVRSPA